MPSNYDRYHFDSNRIIVEYISINERVPNHTYLDISKFLLFPILRANAALAWAEKIN